MSDDKKMKKSEPKFFRKYKGGKILGFCGTNAINNLFRREVVSTETMNKAILFLEERNKSHSTKHAIESFGRLDEGFVHCDTFVHLVKTEARHQVLNLNKSFPVSHPAELARHVLAGDPSALYLVYGFEPDKPVGHYASIRDFKVTDDFLPKGGVAKKSRLRSLDLCEDNLKIIFGKRALLRLYELRPF